MLSFIQGSRWPNSSRSSATHPAAAPRTDGRNLLASLPPEHLDEILHNLPIKDVVRTSALAKAWRCHWTICPGLHLVFSPNDQMGAVESVLSQYTCRVEVFEVRFTKKCCSMLEGWFHALAKKGVGSIKFYFIPANCWEAVIIPNSLFMCLGVKKLDLQFCTIPTMLSTFEGFHLLEILELHQVTFPKNGESTFEALISMSPLLRIIQIWWPVFEGHKDGHVYSEWTIQAPKVEYLVIRSGYDYGWRILDLPSLIEAHFMLGGPQIKRILPSLTKVQKLYMDVRFSHFNWCFIPLI
jgi:hypothetical protein